MSHPEFYIGIDFGHGETSVSRVPGTNGQEVSRIPLRISGDFSDQKVFSAICRGENGKWQFVWSKNDLKRPNVMEGFKGKINTLTEDKREALREFAKLVFKTILENDSELKYDPETGEANFVICIANPSDWRRQDSQNPKDYLAFFQNEAGIKPAKMCINESDAAFYTKFKDYDPTDQVFVIDIGSSTIDFTTYHNSVCNADCCWGHTLGAHLVEDKLVEYGYSNAAEKKENTKNMQIVTQERERLRLGNAESALSLAARFEKEAYFIRTQHGSTWYELDVRIIDLVPNWPQRKQVAFTVSIDSNDVELVIKDYISRLKDELTNAAEKLKSHGISPNKVLLSGGASRMPFVKELTVMAFPDAEVIRDNFPEWVVSDGAARYAKVHTNALEERNKLQNEFSTWAKANLDDKLCSAALSSFNSVLKETVRSGLQSKYLNSSGTLNNLESSIREIIGGIGTSYAFKSKADSMFIAAVDGFIKKKLENIIRSNYGKDITITERFIDPGDTFSNVTANTDYLHGLIAHIGDTLCNTPFEDESDLNWNKSRDPERRSQLMEAYIACCEYDIYNHSVDLDVFINEAISKIDKILADNGLFQISE